MLGMEWLASLRNVKANFRNFVLSWGIRGGKKIMKSDHTLCKSQASWKAMVKVLNNVGEGYMLSYQGPWAHAIEREPIPNEELMVVLAKFEDIFRSPTKLPPQRTCDHAITLMEGVDPPNIRPYRYPYYQNNEIEKLVRK